MVRESNTEKRNSKGGVASERVGCWIDTNRARNKRGRWHTYLAVANTQAWGVLSVLSVSLLVFLLFIIGVRTRVRVRKQERSNVHFVMTVLAVPATSIPITRAMLPLLMDMLACVFESNVLLLGLLFGEENASMEVGVWMGKKETKREEKEKESFYGKEVKGRATRGEGERWSSKQKQGGGWINWIGRMYWFLKWEKMGKRKRKRKKETKEAVGNGSFFLFKEERRRPSSSLSSFHPSR